jgi:adenylate cyclase
MIVAVKTLNQRLTLFLLLPVALLLFLTGFAGYIFARKVLLDEWKEAAVLKLQRAAHYIDMRLNRPIELINMFHSTGEYQGDPAAIQQWLLDQLRAVEGVSKVDLDWMGEAPESMPMGMRGFQMMGSGHMMRFHRGIISQVTSPRYDADAGEQIVSLISDLKNESGLTLGKLKVSIRFGYLMQDIKKLGWWQSDLACLVDDSGKYIAHTEPWTIKGHQLGETGDAFELAVLANMKGKQDGTVLGAGHPPEIVAGFCRINRASWVLLLFAPGEKILAPIIKFRLYYAVAGLISIIVIVVLVRFISGRMVRAVKEISRAAEGVARRDYGSPLPPRGDDEMGQLIRSFNKMVEGLKERDFIESTFGRYVDQEIARELLKRPEAARLGGQKRQVSILISDLRNFTPLSESLSPEQTIHLLNHYFSHMIDAVQRHKGIIVDFFGDSLLVFFDPMENDLAVSAHRALSCGLDMQKELLQHNKDNEAQGLPELEMGIGLNVGEVVVGNIGSTTRTKYGIVGSAVNMTHRIQAVATAGEVVLSQSAYELLAERVSVISQYPVMLKGIRDPVNVYVIKASEPQPSISSSHKGLCLQGNSKEKRPLSHD